MCHIAEIGPRGCVLAVVDPLQHLVVAGNFKAHNLRTRPISFFKAGYTPSSICAPLQVKAGIRTDQPQSWQLSDE